MLSCLLVSSVAYSLPPLQLYIELTPAGGVLELPPGQYAGPAVINRPMTIVGNGEVEIDGGGDGSVITVRADGVSLQGLRIINSGDSHNTADAGVFIEADNTLLEDNVLENVLFGVHLKNAHDNTIRGNRVSSKDREISLRGDGLRMWYSSNNLVENNHFSDIRDIVISNSAQNRISGNIIEHSRIGMEFIFSHENEITDNTITYNTTGIVIVYCNDVVIRGNSIAHMRKLTGSGLSFKESANILISENQIAHSNTGLLANSSLDPENIMTVQDNLFAYNVLGIYFLGEKGGNFIENNRFANNFTDAMGSASTTIRGNLWKANYWDQYQGFDRNHDGTGDQPHDVYLYSEYIWKDTPMSRFFRGSLVMGLLDFAMRLAPFSSPVLEYSDPVPGMFENDVSREVSPDADLRFSQGATHNKNILSIGCRSNCR